MKAWEKIPKGDTAGAQTEFSRLSKSHIRLSPWTPNSVAAICDPLGPFCLAARVLYWDSFPRSRVLLFFAGKRGGNQKNRIQDQGQQIGGPRRVTNRSQEM